MCLVHCSLGVCDWLIVSCAGILGLGRGVLPARLVSLCPVPSPIQVRESAQLSQLKQLKFGFKNSIAGLPCRTIFCDSFLKKFCNFRGIPNVI